jgi:hypothetical protein
LPPNGEAGKFESLQNRSHEVTKRINELVAANALSYPRLADDKTTRVRIPDFINKYDGIISADSGAHEEVVLHGRLTKSIGRCVPG